MHFRRDAVRDFESGARLSRELVRGDGEAIPAAPAAWFLTATEQSGLLKSTKHSGARRLWFQALSSVSIPRDTKLGVNSRPLATSLVSYLHGSWVILGKEEPNEPAW